jgi:hypothetical protein
MRRHLANYLAAGMDALVAKPVNFTNLLEVMQAVMDTDAQSKPVEQLRKAVV